VTALLDSLAAATDDLRRAEVSFALVGGLAVSLRTNPRFTRDADIVVAVVDDAQAEALVRTLLSGGYALQASVEQTEVARLATVRLRSRVAGGVVVDLLFASSGIEPEIVAAAEDLVLAHQLRMPVATIGHLIALKLLSHDDDRRRQDLIDLDELKRAASDVDWATATAACQLIVQRRFHRGRDLLALLRQLQSRS
jgi:hypothetical protein